MDGHKVQVKHKTGNTWRTSTEDISVLDQYKGKEVVAKISDAVMWCGTEQWRQYYIQQGYVATNSTALIEVAELAKQIFQSNREERVAIMVEDGGLSESKANDYCNSKPEVYGSQSAPQSSDGKVPQDRGVANISKPVRQVREGKTEVGKDKEKASGEWQMQELW